MKIIFSIIFSIIFALTAIGQTNDALVLGNPSNAVTDLNQPDNYLVTHNGYALSYNKSRGAANWVAWHLEKSNIGMAERTNAFAPDTTLPREWWIVPSDYTDSGYDRGHMLPSKDRSDSIENNRLTFLMSNMQPQSPKLNQKTWKYLEDYTREVINQAPGNEAYIYAGCYGDKGRIKDKITIPTRCFKIIVVLEEGDDDLNRIDVLNRIIAVDMPNDETVSTRWRSYITTVDDIEKKTGFDFLSNLPNYLQASLESKEDHDNSVTTEIGEKSGEITDTTSSVNTDANGRKYYLGPRGGCYYLTASGNKSYVDKKFCSQETDAPPAKVEPPPARKTVLSDRVYIIGPRGGCYYINSSGKKVYVDRNKCNH